ncbi:MAG: ornithine cyclodeaminase family protein [Deltaproteobacteria bacterium]|nr:ornithine cyclodeaminase family protein [Deltaproteobacteria bacterium]MBW1953129.1 ornithine cyclodeaminase family protein [Deltaproteobacteria bacterium]MBW1987007.1 ornithine cyclodeaminase family protein [Deltaproteobacteria bacterium]
MSLVLTGAEVLEILDMELALAAAEEAFQAYGQGRVNMPPKSYLKLPHGDFRAMYGALSLKSGEICGLKWVNVHPDNPQHGLPTVMAKILLNNPDNAVEIADLDGTYITNFRTGAAGGLAARYLARPEAVTLGLIGAGTQARTQVAAILKVLAIQEIVIYDLIPARARALRDEIISQYGVRAITSETAEAAVRDQEVVVTTTPNTTPVIQRAWINDGTHINAIGADAAGKQELEAAILQDAKIIIDDWAQAQHSGEINVPLAQGQLRPEQIFGCLGEVVTGKKPGRENSREITVFDSTGLIIQDLALGWAVYLRAREQKLGEDKEFIAGLK